MMAPTKPGSVRDREYPPRCRRVPEFGEQSVDLFRVPVRDVRPAAQGPQQLVRIIANSCVVLRLQAFA
jgi:hypothetical protein